MSEETGASKFPEVSQLKVAKVLFIVEKVFITVEEVFITVEEVSLRVGKVSTTIKTVFF